MGERLILEVRRRPILWDPKNKQHNNRVLVDSEWLQVAEILNETKETVKMKWKNLRDSFRKELKKIELARLQEDGDQNWRNHGTWTHFESMQFLRHIMKPRLIQDQDNTSSAETPPLEVASIEIKQELEKHYNDNESFQFNVYSNKTEASSESQNSTMYQTQNMDLSNKESPSTQRDLEVTENSWSGVEVSAEDLSSGTSRKRKAQTSSNYLNCMRELLDLKAKKISLLKERSEEECDDMNFFKSLMPHVKQLPAINKLFFRSQVQNALAQELSKLQNSPRTSPQCDSNMPSTSNIPSQAACKSDSCVKHDTIVS